MLELWQTWQPLLIIAGMWFGLLSLAHPALIAFSLPLAVSLSPELPLALPLRLEDFILLGGLVVVGLRGLGPQSSFRPPVPNRQPFLALLAVELMATLIGALVGTTRLDLSVYSGPVFLAKSIEMFLLYMIVVRLLDTPAKIKNYTWLLLGGGSLLGIYGVISHIRTGVVVDIEGGPTYSLIALALMPPLILGLSLWLTGSSRERWGSGLLLLPICYSFFFTLSRQAYVGAIVMVGMVLWLYKRRMLLLIIPLLLLFLLAPDLAPPAVTERASTLIDPFSGEEVTGLGIYSTRLNAWQYRLPEMLRTNPLTGRGLASLPPGFLDSQYLVVLYYTGLVGLAVFLWLLFSLGRQAWQMYQTAPDRLGQALGLAGLGIVIGFVVTGLGGSPFVAVRAREMFWLLMAGVSAYVIQPQPEAAVTTTE